MLDMFLCLLPKIRWFKIIISVILTIILFVSHPSSILAQQDNRPWFQVFLEQAKSVVKGRSQRQALGKPTGSPRGGAGRGRCPALIPLDKDNEVPLTAFVPVIQEKQSSLSKSDNVAPSKLNYVWGQTIEQHPTFWFYIPYTYKELEIEYGKFVLLDKYQHIINEPIFVKLPSGSSPSIAKFTLPNIVSLEINQEYNWYFSIICNPLKPSRNPGVTGWIERVELPNFSPGNYRYYANQGIWYDTVTRLVESTDPQTLPQQLYWLQLIEFIFKNEQDTSLNDNVLNQIAKLPIWELTPVPYPESLRIANLSQ